MALLVEALPMSVALLTAFFAAVSDHKTGRIPNKLTMSTIVLGLLYHLVFGGFSGFLESICAAAVCALVPVLMFRFGAMGGGDVKLFAAIGALAGLDLGLEIQTVSFLAGALQGTVVWARQGKLRYGLTAAASLVIPFAGRRVRRNQKVMDASRTSIRFGPAVFVGASLAVVLHLLEGGVL